MMISEETFRSEKIIFFNDILDFRSTPKNKFEIFLLALKNLIRSILILIRGENKPKGFMQIKNLENIYKDGEEFILIIKEGLSDYRVHSSRQSKFYKKIEKAKPALISSRIINAFSSVVSFSIFIKKQIKYLDNIIVEGYIENTDSFKEKFEISLDKNAINSFSRPTYWLEISIEIPYSKLPKPKEIVNLYVTNIIFNKKTDNDLSILQGNIISSEINFTPLDNRKILLLSFDGISTSDLLLNNDSKFNYPHISRFAEENFWFKNAITSSTVTATSGASLITGLNLPGHLIFNYDDDYLSSDMRTISKNILTLGEKAKQQLIPSYGLFTFGKWVPQYGLSRGFNDYRSINSGAIQNFPWLDEVTKIISRKKAEPFLFAMHHPGGHSPFLPRVNNRYDGGQYSSHIETMKYIDSFFGSILNTLKSIDAYEDSLIIFLADHGRSLRGEFDRMNFNFTDNRLFVPLIIKHPDWTKDSVPYSTEDYFSAQTMTHEVISNYINFSDSTKVDSGFRLRDGINWLCETMDYSRKNHMGLVGFDSDFKYTIFYEFDFHTGEVGKFNNLLKHSLHNSDSKEGFKILEAAEKSRVIQSSRDYLFSSLTNFTESKPNRLGPQTYLIQTSEIK